ncbi:MAG TPA: hypothetical protein VF428_09965 [Casimicrobiaceae bacterium]
MLFVASAIKSYVLCTALQKVDRPDVAEALEKQELELDDTVWVFGSPTFTPPDIEGTVSERTAMEAMITQRQHRHRHDVQGRRRGRRARVHCVGGPREYAGA